MRRKTFKEWQAKIVAKSAGAARRKILRNRAAEAQGGRCFYCDAAFSDANKPTFEHIVPASRGGFDTAGNCVASCFRCNQERGNTSHQAFLRFKKFGYGSK